MGQTSSTLKKFCHVILWSKLFLIKCFWSFFNCTSATYVKPWETLRKDADQINPPPLRDRVNPNGIQFCFVFKIFNSIKFNRYDKNISTVKNTNITFNIFWNCQYESWHECKSAFDEITEDRKLCTKAKRQKANINLRSTFFEYLKKWIYCYPLSFIA